MSGRSRTASKKLCRFTNVRKTPLQQQVASTRGPLSHLPRGMLLHSSMPQTAGRPWRNGLKHAIKKQGQNTWNWLLSLLPPRAPLFSPCTLSHPPPPTTTLLLQRTHCLWVHESLHFTMPNSQLTTNPTTASPPPPPLAFITMTTHNEESKRERKRAEARKKRWTRGRERGALTSASICKKGTDHSSGGLPWPTRVQNQQQTASQTEKKVCFNLSSTLQNGFLYNVYFSRIKEGINCSCWIANGNSAILAWLWAFSDLNK